MKTRWIGIALVLTTVASVFGAEDIQALLKRGGPFTWEERLVLLQWVEKGAPWPEGVRLTNLPKIDKPLGDDIELVRQFRAAALSQPHPATETEMGNYRGYIPMTGVAYDMVAIPGGEFAMGSPETEPNRKEDEGPVHRVKVAPFWMGRFEVTWTQFEPFMITDVARRSNGQPMKIPPRAPMSYITSSPTTPYTHMDFGMGFDEGFPAIAMSQHAASKFCQWLSVQTGHFYRLPTEAEWEYACRAGTTTAYSFGDDPAIIGEYAWFWGNCEGKYQKVGRKRPNPWGLHDMHGNVIEWCLDQYVSTAYATGFRTVPAVRVHPRVARGGSWYDDPDLLRSAARVSSSRKWNIQDAELPPSMWYLSSGEWVGFRLARSLELPPAEEIHALWNSGWRFESDDEKLPPLP